MNPGPPALEASTIPLGYRGASTIPLGYQGGNTTGYTTLLQLSQLSSHQIDVIFTLFYCVKYDSVFMCGKLGSVYTNVGSVNVHDDLF